jgi:acyl-CoA thioesterase I
MKNEIKNISVWGDSILKGAVTGTSSGYLFDVLDENSLSIASQRLGFILDNQSVFGSIITKSQKRLNKSIEKGVECDIGIIESGGNDCDYDWATVSANPDGIHSPRVPLDQFMKILDEMVKTLRNNKITPLLMTMPALVCDRWFEHISRNNSKENILKFLNGDFYKLYRNHEIYNNHIVKYCHENNVQYVDMRFAILESPNYRDLMCLDGIHPNENGYKFMASIWEKELPKIKLEF